jgi:uncharacterized protein
MRDRLGEFSNVVLDAGLIAIICAVFIGGFLRGFVGFGAALVMVPVLTLAVGPHLAVAISSLIGLPTVVQLLPEAVRFAERGVVVPVACAIFLAAPGGAWLLMAVDPGIMKIAISGLVVLMVVLLAQGWTFKGKASLGTLLMAGAAGGLLQGSSGMGGPPVVAVALARAAEPRQQRGNVLALMTALALSSVLPLSYYGLFTAKALVMGALLIPINILATALGSRSFARWGSRHYRNAALATLGLIGVTTLVLAVARYLDI